MYNKIFTKILDSSIWLEPTPTRIVWITLLAAMDQDGYAHFSAIQNLALRAQISIKDTKEAVRVLTSPDSNSADPEFDGRRIERVPGGFIILNAEKHKDMVTRVVQREQTRKRVAKHRANKKSNKHVTNSNELVTQSDTDTDTYTEAVSNTNTEAKNKTVSAEPQSDSTQLNVIVTIPLVNKTEFQITNSMIEDWQQSFPGIDVHQILRNIREWNLSNPTRRKTIRGIRRHITNWLAKEQNRAPAKTGSTTPSKLDRANTAFKDFESDLVRDNEN